MTCEMTHTSVNVTNNTGNKHVVQSVSLKSHTITYIYDILCPDLSDGLKTHKTKLPQTTKMSFNMFYSALQAQFFPVKVGSSCVKCTVIR